MENKNKHNISTNKNNSISISESCEKNNNELPIINSNIVKKKPKQKVFYKKIIFNPISYDYQNKIKLLSQVKSIAKTLNKHYSMKEINEFANRKYLIKNYQRNTDNNNNSNSKRKEIKKHLISRNISEVNIKRERPNLNIINLTKNCQTKENNKPNLKKSENKSKIFSKTNRIIIDFRNCLKAVYDPKKHEDKKYQNNKDFIHNYLYKMTNDETKTENKKDTKEFLPKFEYISYSGTTNKVITKLTEKNYEPKEEKKLKLIKIKFKSPYLINYENEDDYRNKKYIKILEYKRKKTRDNENKPILYKETKKLNELNKKGLNEVRKIKNKSFHELVNNVFEQKDKITYKLTNLINFDKKLYEKDFEAINSIKY